IQCNIFLSHCCLQAEDGIRDRNVTGVQTCALPIYSKTVARVWSLKTKANTLVPTAKNGATSVSQPPADSLRRLKIEKSAGKLTKNTPTAKRPVGPAVSVSVAAMVPMAAGSMREVAMERSKDAQVKMTPKATTGSGRMPLLYGSQKAKNINAAVQCATRRSLIIGPKRGRISRERMNHVKIAAISVGIRMNTDVAEILDKNATRSKYG